MICTEKKSCSEMFVGSRDQYSAFKAVYERSVVPGSGIRDT
jgi:hypothetical protein